MKTYLTSLIAGSLAAMPVSAGEICGRNYASPGQAYSEVARTPGVQVALNNAQFVALADQKAMVVWTFTKAGHPASPAVVCRRPIQVGGVMQVQLQAICSGPKEACDALIADFQALLPR